MLSPTPPRAGLRAFGLSLLANMPPPGAWVAAPPAEPSLHLQAATAEEIAECWSGPEAIGWEGTIDGARFMVERGRAGDHRFVHGEPPEARGTPVAGTPEERGTPAAGTPEEPRTPAPGTPEARGTPVAGTRAIHHLSADACTLRCAPADPEEQSWWRVVLDSVLFTVALLQGREALHAGAVATPEGALAIAAATGGGKSTLLCELLRDGLTLMSDDVLVLEARGEDPPLAHPGPPLMTVPAGAAPLRGAPIASVEEERWISVPVHPDAVPLSALVVLNRGPGLATSLHPARDPLAVLVGSLLRFPRLPERERTRF
ncbi:MAG: hypothetical protein ABSH36_06865, partial [Solirubrobacteraceae bacterium]